MLGQQLPLQRNSTHPVITIQATILWQKWCHGKRNTHRHTNPDTCRPAAQMTRCVDYPLDLNWYKTARCDHRVSPTVALMTSIRCFAMFLHRRFLLVFSEY